MPFLFVIFSRAICVELSHCIYYVLLCIIIHKMQNPGSSRLKTSLKKEFPGLLLSDEGFFKESEKLLQLAFIILKPSELFAKILV